MVQVYGTSHVSKESIELVDKVLEQENPEIVALELDPLRLEALLDKRNERSENVFLWLAEKFQMHVGRKTGIMPGEEMKYAFSKAIDEGLEVALIDQDIRITVQRLKLVRRKEKFRAGVSLLAATVLPGSFDPSSIPETEKIDSLLQEFRQEFPELHRVLIQERNQIMAENLSELGRESNGEVIAFLGAGHVEEVSRLLSKTTKK